MERPLDLIELDGELVTPSQVCNSNAGYYIGRLHWDEDIGCMFPYSRESVQYFRTYEMAHEALVNGDYAKRSHP